MPWRRLSSTVEPTNSLSETQTTVKTSNDSLGALSAAADIYIRYCLGAIDQISFCPVTCLATLADDTWSKLTLFIGKRQTVLHALWAPFILNIPVCFHWLVMNRYGQQSSLSVCEACLVKTSASSGAMSLNNSPLLCVFPHKTHVMKSLSISSVFAEFQFVSDIHIFKQPFTFESVACCLGHI